MEVLLADIEYALILCFLIERSILMKFVNLMKLIFSMAGGNKDMEVLFLVTITQKEFKGSEKVFKSVLIE